MQFLLLAIVFAIIFGISWHNARVVGLDWLESKYIGGYVRFVVWMAWLMSVVGFSWCYVAILATMLDAANGYIDTKAISAALSPGYAVLLPGVVAAGTLWWVDSLVVVWRQRDLPRLDAAAWNTFAEAYNRYNPVRGVGAAFKSIGSMIWSLAGDIDVGWWAALMTVVGLIVAAAVAPPLVATELIRRHYAASRPLPQRLEAAA